jgi:hypothetical protein
MQKITPFLWFNDKAIDIKCLKQAYDAKGKLIKTRKHKSY